MFCKICLSEIKEVDKSSQSGYHDKCLKRLFGSTEVKTTLEFGETELQQLEFAKKYSKRMSISGHQKKISIKVDNNLLVPTDTGGTYILKPETNQYSEIPANEHVSMEIGRLLGIDTALCGLISLKGGTNAYITKRFDRDLNKREEKYHQEDMAQIMGRQKDEQEDFKYNSNYEEVGKKILEASGNKQILAIRLIERIIHRFIVGDEDYHLKNISLHCLEHTGHYGALTPNYDAVHTLLYLKSDAGFFGLKDGLFSGDFMTEEYSSLGFPSQADFISLAERLKIAAAPIQAFIQKIKDKSDSIRELIQASYLSNSNKEKYTSNLDERIRMLFSSSSK